MKRVVCFGEALIDFLNTGRQFAGDLPLSQFTQFPGGAPANVAVAVAKLGGDAAFAGQVGDDQFGSYLLEAMQLYGVDTSLALTHPTAPTALAFVLLDEKGERSFTFRRDNTADMVLRKAQIDAHWFDDESIVHLCSNTLTDKNIAEVTRHVVSLAAEREAFISFDVNLRHNLWPSGTADETLVNEFVRRADLVKFSSEEIDFLCGGDRDGYLQAGFDRGLSAALITDGPGNLEIRTAMQQSFVTPPGVQAVDTTGGGDAFVGALLFGLGRDDDCRAVLSDNARLNDLATIAAHCGAFAVTKPGAFPAFPVFADVAEHWD